MGLERGGGLVSEGGVLSVGVGVGFDGGEEFDAGIGVGDEEPSWSISVLRVPMKDSVQAW